MEILEQNNEIINNKLIFQDHTYLINEIYNTINSDFITRYSLGNAEECSRIGYGISDKKNSFIVMAEDTAVELGSPQKVSISKTLWTTSENIAGNNVYVKNDQLSSFENRSVSFLQLIIVQFDNADDAKDYRLQSVKGLSNKIPGLMCRSMQGKMWIRINKSLMEKDFSLYSLAECLYHSYMQAIPAIKAMDIFLIADDDPLILKFEPIISTAESISENNNKVRWIEDGIVNCDDLNCASCEEKPVCDSLRQIVIEKRKT